MTNGYSRRTTELQRPEALQAGVPGNESRLMARETHPVIRSQTGSSKAEASKEHTARETEGIRTRLDLLYKIGRKIGSFQQPSQLAAEITKMTQHTLKASASSLFLIDTKDRNLGVKL